MKDKKVLVVCLLACLVLRGGERESEESRKEGGIQLVYDLQQPEDCC